MPSNASIPLLSLLALASALLLLLPAPSLAHGLHLDVYVESGAAIRGEAYYQDSQAAGARVEVFAPDGEKLGETETDEEGLFAFEASFRCDHRFVVTHMGHRATETIPAEDLPDSLPPYEGGSD